MSESYSSKQIRVRVFVNSFPKSGTHLVEKLLLLLGFNTDRNQFVGHYKPKKFFRFILSRSWVQNDSVLVGVDHPAMLRSSYVKFLFDKLPKGGFVRGHAIYSEQLHYLVNKSGLKTIIVLRDPRDIVVSHANYVLDNSSHPLHDYYKREFNSFEDALLFSIKGGLADSYYLDSIGMRARGINDWIDRADTCAILFEDLVGPMGGGSTERQFQCISGLLKFLDETIIDEEIVKVAAELFGGTDTFRKGVIGGWENIFNKKIEEVFNQHASEFLALWGYS